MSDKTVPPITKEAIEQYQKQRIEEFMGKFNALLQEYDFDLTAKAQIADDGRIVASPWIGPKKVA